jgi:beta-glucosidase/6-phospho-beta-glucosidase/beta-galactosidase
MNTLLRLEKCLLPPRETVHWNHGKLRVEKYSTLEKVIYCAKNLFSFVGLLFIAPFTIPYELLAKKEIAPLNSLQQTPIWPPEQRGFATSLFQTSGLGTKWSAPQGLIGKCDWDRWMDDPKHIAHPNGFDYNNFFTDVLSNPDPYIEMLKNHHVTAHRFSLEWSVICPSSYEFDDKAILLYRNFIKKLLAAGITPSITLNHFAVPDWFYEAGSFHNPDNISDYLDYALAALELFPEVKDWWSFNELNIRAFQQTREVYPTDLPEGSSLSSRIHAAGISTRNMLIAHCLLHKKVAELYPDKNLGVTHQWLKFDTENGNPLERILAYYLTKFGFSTVYNFFKDGQFSFEFPFIANIQFKIPTDEFETNHHFLSRIGVQAYPKPMLKMGLNHGQTYPGLPSAIKNLPLFSFGSSCERGGTVMRFGPRWHAEGMIEALDEAFALTPNVFITEFGSDAMIQKWDQPNFSQDNIAQAQYLQALIEQIHQYSLTTLREIKGLFCWSDLRRQLEWENGLECQLAIIDPIVDSSRHLTSYTQTPAAQYLSQTYS